MPKWEKIDDDTARLKVFGGWIVHICKYEDGECAVFVPDITHEWTLDGQQKKVDFDFREEKESNG